MKEFAATADPAAEINKLEADEREARSHQVDLLSPRYFGESVAKLDAAKKRRGNGDDNADVLQTVAEGRAQLDKALEVARVSALSLEAVMAARSEALTAGADRFMAKDFKDADEALTSITKSVEKDDLKGAEAGRGKLKDQYLGLELAALKADKLGGTEKTVEAAIKEGAEKDAARTLAVAKKNIADTDAFITANRHDAAGIQAHSDTARISADRLLKITRDAKVTDNKDAEAIILEKEAAQKVTTAGEVALAKTQADLTKERGDVVALEAQKQGLASDKQGLEDDKAFTARLDSIKTRFSASEADVSQNGNKILIRMKSLDFPSGKAMITAANFPVLGKVQQAIQDLGNGLVTVTGHTDGNGSKAANKKLSQERADAVKAYLAASGKLLESNITATGEGDEQPIATNKTAAGRAQNRRVDVLIDANRSAMGH